MHKLHILVVDDDRVMLTLFVGVLRHEGYGSVDIARNGEEALAKLKDRPPDIVFLDIEMPDLGGLDALKAIKELGIPTKVVMVTATPTAHNVKAAKEGGASGFLVKPVSPKKVADAIRFCQAGPDTGAGQVSP
jgi:two-component system chemotaxis response regulator CheY